MRYLKMVLVFFISLKSWGDLRNIGGWGFIGEGIFFFFIGVWLVISGRLLISICLYWDGDGVEIK